MNLRSLLLLFALSSSLYAAPPPELAPLQQQWGNAVTTPHETALADLNTKFTAALGNAVTAAKQAGKLDEVLAIQDESQFHSMVEAELEKHSRVANNSRYEELEKILHETLKRQDSE